MLNSAMTGNLLSGTRLLPQIGALHYPVRAKTGDLAQPVSIW
jgi:hypothetical protein